MNQIIEKLRMQMHKAIEVHGITSNQALEISQELDIFVSLEQKRIYENNMTNNYCKGM